MNAWLHACNEHAEVACGCAELVCGCQNRRYLNWVAAEGGLERDGRWSCGTHDYPSMHHSLMHPCANDRRDCCGDSGYTPFLLRYESFFHSKNALLVLAYEVRCLGSLPVLMQHHFSGRL